jgi:hypothetical protein
MRTSTKCTFVGAEPVGVSIYDVGSAIRNALNHSHTLDQRRQIIAAAVA